MKNENNDLKENYKNLRTKALSYVVTHFEPHGNLSTLRNLQNCFIAGHNHGRLLTTEEIAKVSEMHSHEKTTTKTTFVFFCGVSLILGVVLGKL